MSDAATTRFEFINRHHRLAILSNCTMAPIAELLDDHDQECAPEDAKLAVVASSEIARWVVDLGSNAPILSH